MDAHTVIETPQSSLLLYPLDPDMVSLLNQCVEDVRDELDVRPEIIMYGKICHQQRSVGFYSDDVANYNYSNTKTPSKPMKPNLHLLLSFMNKKFGADFNAILVNRYENGEDYIGRHSDDERGVHPHCGVVALSVGAPRKFRIREKSSGRIVADIQTRPDQIIQMAGAFQNEFTHEIPVEKKVKDCRYSFTFRSHYL